MITISTTTMSVSRALQNPLANCDLEPRHDHTVYEATIETGRELKDRPAAGGGVDRIRTHHAKRRMTVWERLRCLTDSNPNIYWQNWGPNLDGASIVTGVLSVNGRDIAVYGHDFTLRAGSMDATNGAKLARLIRKAGQYGIPLIGMNDSAGAYVPAGVGGLDGYSEAFTALRQISGVVPTISLMFGYNAGGGAYLPRQGSFVVQAADTFIGLTGPGVVASVLGETVTPDELGGPRVHSLNGVADLIARDEADALQMAIDLLGYLPDNNHSGTPTISSTQSLDQHGTNEAVLLRRTFDSPAGMSAPLDITIWLQLVCDHGDFFELQPTRAKNLVTAFARLGGIAVGIVANNSAVDSGQIDTAAARKATRFIRFCNLYNLPVIFVEDTTGFLPGSEQEAAGIVLEGRRLLDSIIDLRTPSLTMIVRNAFGGAYAGFNSHFSGADLVFAMPMARIAVMGPAGKDFVYKSDLAAIETAHRAALQSGHSNADAVRDEAIERLTKRYEDELMNPREALALGSVSEIVLPGTSREILGHNLAFLMSRYSPSAMTGTQREFE